MGKSDQLKPWLIEALTSLGGSGSVVDVSRRVWERHEVDLRSAGDLFYTWQYDLRWAAQKLRDGGVLKKTMPGSVLWAIAEVSEPTSTSPSDDWTSDEIVATVQSYFRMLRAEVAGEAYRKVDENRRVVEATGRSRGAVEFKYANISAVLDELGMRFVRGYKPRFNYQRELRSAVLAELSTQVLIDSRSAEMVEVNVRRDVEGEQES